MNTLAITHEKDLEQLQMILDIIMSGEASYEEFQRRLILIKLINDRLVSLHTLEIEAEKSNIQLSTNISSE